MHKGPCPCFGVSLVYMRETKRPTRSQTRSEQTVFKLSLIVFAEIDATFDR